MDVDSTLLGGQRAYISTAGNIKWMELDPIAVKASIEPEKR